MHEDGARDPEHDDEFAREYVQALLEWWDLEEARFVECWGNMPTYDDFPRMLDDLHPDIVCIATRQTMHAEQCEQAAAAGVRGILCDKPLATSLAETDRIVASCQRANVALAFGLDRRWWNRNHFVCQLVADGTIGKVESVIAYGLPNLIFHGCHLYDGMLALTGDVEPSWVSGFVDDLSKEPPESNKRIDPTGRAQIGFANGAVALVTPDGGRLAYEVLGDRGRLLILNDFQDVYLWTLNGGNQLCSRSLEIPPEAEGWPAGPAAVADLAEAVQSGGTTACDLDHARRATEIGFGIHISSSMDGAKVSLPAAERSLSIPSFPWGNE